MNDIIIKLSCIFLLIAVYGCQYEYAYDEHKNMKKTMIFRKYSFRKYHSYTADSVLIKGFFLNPISDTIYKRCFNHTDIQLLVKLLNNQNIVDKNNYGLSKSSLIIDDKCEGLFFSHRNYDSKLKNRIQIPVLRFDNRIVLNVSFVDGRYFSGDSAKVEADLNSFRFALKGSFSNEELQRISGIYRNGVNLILNYR